MSVRALRTSLALVPVHDRMNALSAYVRTRLTQRWGKNGAAADAASCKGEEGGRMKEGEKAD